MNQSFTVRDLKHKSVSLREKLQSGETVLLTYQGRAYGRAVPVGGVKPSASWDDIMAPVRAARAKIKKPSENLVLTDRERHRR